MAQSPGQEFLNTAEVHPLNTQRGITNIGSNPENDIVIHDARVLPFHLMLDHRQKPYRIIMLNPAADVSINGVRLAGMDPCEVADLNQVQFAGFMLRAQEGGNGSPVESIAILPLETARLAAPQTVVTPPVFPSAMPGLAATPAAGAPVPFGSQTFQSRADDVILVSLAQTAQTANVEETAIYQVTVINGGPIVASFDVMVEGLPAEWVEIAPQKLNLYEGGRASAYIRVTPPRDPSSRAATYPFQVKVSSQNYPGNLALVLAELTINPYYDFAVGNINPRSKSASWSKKSAVTYLPISNFGNSTAGFTVQAQDEENACQFEFPLDPRVSLVRQAEVHVPPGETLEVPVQITALKRKLVRLRGRQYQYSVATTSLDQPDAVRTVSGTFTSLPLFGIFSILLALILLGAAAYLILQPRIMEFTLAKDVIRLGENAQLRWNVSLFTSDLRIEGVSDPVTGARGQISTKPTTTATTYTLVAGNWLSKMLRMEDLRSQPVTVLAIPSYPEIVTFFVDKNQIFQGDEIDIKWSVKNADEALLTVEGVTQTLKGDALNGEQKVKLKGDSLVILEARNNSGTVTRSEFVRASPIEITVNNFSVNPKEIVKGDPVTIAWDITGAGVESVMISPFKDPLPASGSLQFFPTASMEFILTVKARDQQEIRLLSVGVLDKIEAKAPTVDIFKVAPDSLAVGGGSVEFSWSVSGQTTKIEITSKDGVLATNLPAQGFRSYNVSKTTAFFLTAYNGSLTNSKDAKVTVAEAKKPVSISVKSIEPSGDIRKGAPVLIYIDIFAQNGSLIGSPATFGWPEISGKIVVTDGYDTCPIDLPLRSCSMTLNHAEVPKYIWATYQGDDNYGVHESAHVLFPFNVVGAPSHFVTKDFVSFGSTVTNITAGQLFNLNVELSPDDPTATTAITGTVVVTQAGKPFCSIELVASGNPSTPFNAKGSCPAHPTLPLAGDSAGKKITLDLAYTGNGTYAKLSDTATVQVDKAPSVTSITSDLSAQTVVGQGFLVSYKVIVAPLSFGSGVPSGSVTIRDAGYTTDSCTNSLSAGSASCILVLHSPGIRSLEAIYEGDGSFINSSTPSPSPYFHTVAATPTLTTITTVTPLTVAEIGQLASVHFKVEATGGGSGTPTGSVDVFQDGIYKCSGTLALGVGSCSALLDKINAVTFTAEYQGDGATPSSYQASALSAGFPFTVNQAQTRTHITNVHAPDPTKPAEVVVEFTASALRTDSAIQPSGKVDVVANGNTAYSCLGVAYLANTTGTCNLTLPLQGANTISVAFKTSADQRFADSLPANSDSTTFLVKQTTSLNVTTSQSNTVVDTAVTFTITVDTTGTWGDVTGKLTLSADSGELCSDIPVMWPNKTYTCQLTFTTAGPHVVTGAYIPDGTSNYSGSSKTITYNVALASTSIGLPTFTPPSPQVAQNVTVSFTVSTADTTVPPTGSVTVSAGPGESCSTSTLVGGAGSCSLTFATSGSRLVSLNYTDATGTRYLPSGRNVNQAVVTAGTITSLVFLDADSNPISTAVVGQTVTLKATVTVPNSSSLNPTSGTVVIPACTPAAIGLSGSNVATCTTSYAAVGPVSTTAQFTPSALDANKISGSTSSPATLTIDPAPTITTVTFNPVSGVGVFGQAITATVSVAGSQGGVPNAGTVDVTTAYTGPQSPGPTVTPSCTARPVSTGQATCSLNFPAAGNWTISAKFNGTPNFQASTLTPSASYSLGKAATTLSLIPSQLPSLADETVTFTVNLSVVPPGAGIPTGDFTITATPASSGSPGPTTRTTTWPTSGGNLGSITFNGSASWSVVAKFTDSSGNFLDFTLPAVNYTTALNTSVTSITPPPPPTISSNSLVVTFSVSGLTPNGTPPASGTNNDVTVYAYNGATQASSCHASLATGNCTLNSLNTSGTVYTIYAVYAGNYLFATSTSPSYNVTR